MDLDIRKINYDEQFLPIIIQQINSDIESGNKGLYLLDLSKGTYNIIEKFVYDYTTYQLNRLNIEFNDDICVEFWVKNKFDTHVLHVDCDEYEKKTKLNYLYPLLSSVTYFNKSDIPTLITNIDMDRYKYKNYEDNISLYFSFPETNKQITFEPKYFHGSVLLEDLIDNNRLIIAINIWNRKPSNIPFYKSNNENYDKSLIIFNYEEINNCIINTPLSKEYINYELMETLLYKNTPTLFYKFKNIIDSCKNNSEFNIYKLFLDNIIEKEIITSKLKTKYGDIINDINEITTNEYLKYNRFLQRFMYKSFYNKEICNWIIDETEDYAKLNGGWTTNRHNNYPTTDIPVERIKSIFSYILSSFKSINTIIKDSYCIDDRIILDIDDLFIVKYKHDEQNYLDLHTDGSFLTFSILLNSDTDFEGGGTYFDDGLKVKPKQGDLLIHSGKIKHCGLPIEKGVRYLLVGFINIRLVV